MGRLRTPTARIASAPERMRRVTDAHGHDDRGEAGRAWYHLARWKHPERGLRIKVLIRDLFTCQWPGCGRLEADTSRLVADHKTPHRGDPTLFWDEGNLWTLCKPCHDRLKQALEANAVRR